MYHCQCCDGWLHQQLHDRWSGANGAVLGVSAAWSEQTDSRISTPERPAASSKTRTHQAQHQSSCLRADHIMPASERCTGWLCQASNGSAAACSCRSTVAGSAQSFQARWSPKFCTGGRAWPARGMTQFWKYIATCLATLAQLHAADLGQASHMF